MCFKKIQEIFCSIFILFSVMQCGNAALSANFERLALREDEHIEMLSRKDGRQREKDEQLYDAVFKLDAKEIKRLIESNADVNGGRRSIFNHYYSLFQNVLYSGKDGVETSGTDILKLLIASRADVNKYDLHDVESPLHSAARGGHAEGIQLLVESKADIEASQSSDGSGTPLCEAICRGHLKPVELLIQLGANIPPDVNRLLKNLSTDKIAGGVEKAKLMKKSILMALLKLFFIQAMNGIIMEYHNCDEE